MKIIFNKCLDDIMDTELKEHLRDQVYEMIIDDQLQLPVLPHVVNKALSMANDEKKGALQLSTLIHKDQSLAGNVLKTANCALYCGRDKIVSLQQAIARLGVSLLKEIIITTAIKEIFQSSDYQKEIQDIWKHALATAAFSREVAILRRKNVESAYLSSLLHSIGKPVCINTLSKICSKKNWKKDRKIILELSQELYKKIGSTLAEKWQLPKQVTSTICYHTDYLASPDFKDEVRTCALSLFLAQEIFLPQEKRVSEKEILQHPVIETLNLYPDEIKEILKKEQEVQDLIASFT